MQQKPFARIQIALYPDGNVQVGMEGPADKNVVARGMALAMQMVLGKIDQLNSEPHIEVPTGPLAQKLAASR